MSPFLVSFIGGILTFLSPCIVPMLVIYFFSVALISLIDIKNKFIETRDFIFGGYIFFSGLALVFILNTLPGPTQQFMMFYHLTLSKIAGGIIIYFAVALIKTIPESVSMIKNNASEKSDLIWLLAVLFILGISFGVAWMHCLDPVLSMIINTSNYPENTLKGIFMLSFYSAGLSIPFLLSGLTLNKIISRANILKKYEHVIVNIGIFILVLIGISLIFTPWWTAFSKIFVGLTPDSISNQIMRIFTRLVG